jgi:hypothetical protein
VKRLTDTEKWADPWFRKLAPEIKALWSYVHDNCDSCGVWTVEIDVASFYIGAQISEQKAAEALSEQITVFGHSWLVRGFVELQYGALSATCAAHTNVIDRIYSHGIEHLFPNLPPRRLPEEKKKNRSKISRRLRWLILQRDGFRCKYCGDDSGTASLQVDHVIPVASGGSNSRENLITACQDCNGGKSDSQLEVLCPI